MRLSFHVAAIWAAILALAPDGLTSAGGYPGDGYQGAYPGDGYSGGGYPGGYIYGY